MHTHTQAGDGPMLQHGNMYSEVRYQYYHMLPSISCFPPYSLQTWTSWISLDRPARGLQQATRFPSFPTSPQHWGSETQTKKLFSVGARDLNSALHISMASTSPNEPSSPAPTHLVEAESSPHFYKVHKAVKTLTALGHWNEQDAASLFSVFSEPMQRNHNLTPLGVT